MGAPRVAWNREATFVLSTAAQVLLMGWNLDPSVLLGLLALGGGYLYAIGPLRQRYAWGDPTPRARVAAFFLGLAVLAFALLSPLDLLGDVYLFSAHMVQHMLLAMAVPPLLLLGTPGWLLRPLVRRPSALRIARLLTFPLVAFVLFNTDFWVWHLPPLYDLTLRNGTVHIFEHLTFLAFGVLNWFPILSPLPELPRLPRSAQLLYLFVSCQPMVVLGALLTFASHPLYAPYAAAPRIFGISVAADQQLGGLIMWIPGNFAYILVMSIIFFLWLEQQNADDDEADAALDDADIATTRPAASAGQVAAGE
jgi:putative membrane protein